MQLFRNGWKAAVLLFTRPPVPLTSDHGRHQADFLLEDSGKLPKPQYAIDILIVPRRVIQSMKMRYEEKPIE